MSSKTPLLILVGVLIAAIVGVYTILVLDGSKKKNGNNQANKFAKYNKKYLFLINNFITRRSFKKVVDRISELSIYNFMEIRIQSVKYYSTTAGISLGLIIAASVMFRDIIATMVIVVYGLVMRNTLISKRIDGIRFQLLKQFSNMLGSLRETYTLTGEVPQAIHDCTSPPLLVKPMEAIYNILTATDAKDRLDEFYETSPFRLLRTLASTCYILNDEGDDESKFKNGITLIKNEADSEIRKLTLQRIKFSSLEYLPIAPLFVVGFIENFFMSTIPGTSQMYQGMLGYISRLLIVTLSAISYYIITTITDSAVVSQSDRSDIIDVLLSKKFFMGIVQDVKPKHMKQINKINKSFKGALSDKDIDYFYAQKVIFAPVVFVFMFVALIVMTLSAREFTYNNVQSLSLLGGTELTAEERHSLFEMDARFMEMSSLPDDLTIETQVRSVFPKASSLDISDQVERVKKKFSNYHNLGYRWWFILVSYAVATIAWFVPEMQIALRKYLVKAEAEEDVMQMTTIIAILMHTSMDTLDAIYWLYKNSAIHSDFLLFAYHEYPSDAEKAIERLKSKSAVPEFHQLCDKLKTTIHRITLAEAFSDLNEEREHQLKIREMVDTNAIEKKRRLASPIALAPLAVLVIGHVLAPIGILGFNEFKNALSQAGF